MIAEAVGDPADRAGAGFVSDAAQAVSTVPVVLSTAPMPRSAVLPLIWEKRPPMTVSVPAGSMTMASTCRSVVGAQGSSLPSDALNAVRFLRAVPLAWVNRPPA
ncbi:MAG: hypothetical protein K0Q52_3127 [Microbacterium sp.]|nr:hypothetical protein [Microbacterium sp.]